MEHFSEIIPIVLRHEGGYVNDPLDKGGETNYGISKRSYPNEDIKRMTPERATEIYRRDFWVPAQCSSMPPAIRGIHFDTAVNCGLTRAAKILQAAAGVTVDGLIGPVTLRGAQHVTLQMYAAERLAWYDRIITADPSQAKYRKGWAKRTMSWL